MQLFSFTELSHDQKHIALCIFVVSYSYTDASWERKEMRSVMTVRQFQKCWI